MLQCDEGAQHRHDTGLCLRAGDPGTGLIPAPVQALQHPGAQCIESTAAFSCGQALVGNIQLRQC